MVAVLLCCDTCKYPFQRIRQLPFFQRACPVGVQGDWVLSEQAEVVYKRELLITEFQLLDCASVCETPIFEDYYIYESDM